MRASARGKGGTTACTISGLADARLRLEFSIAGVGLCLLKYSYDVPT